MIQPRRAGNRGLAHVTLWLVKRLHVLVNKLTKAAKQKDPEVLAQKKRREGVGKEGNRS